MVDLHGGLAAGTVALPVSGSVTAGTGSLPPFVVLDEHGTEIEPLVGFLRDLALGDVSPLTCRSYGYDLLRWWRVLGCRGVAWDRASEAEVAVLVGWLRNAPNPQRVRRRVGGPSAGAVNLRTGKPSLRAGYPRRTINHSSLSVPAVAPD